MAATWELPFDVRFDSRPADGTGAGFAGPVVKPPALSDGVMALPFPESEREPKTEGVLALKSVHRKLGFWVLAVASQLKRIRW